MSIPFGHDTVTLISRTENVAGGKTQVSYAAQVLTGCSWKRSRSWRRDGEDLVPYEGITCRVPCTQARPKPGDLMILGEVSAEVASYAQYQALIEQYAATGGAFVVASVADNARPGMPLPHWAARS